MDSVGAATGLENYREMERTLFRKHPTNTAQQSNSLSKVRRGEIDLPLKKLPLLESAVPGITALYMHPLWDLLNCDHDWSQALVFSCMKRLPERLTDKLFLPKSILRSGAFERRQKSLGAKFMSTITVEDNFDSLALRLALFREAALSGNEEECRVWAREIEAWLHFSVLPNVSQDLGSHLLEAIHLGVGKAADQIEEGSYTDRDDLIDIFIDEQNP